MKISNDYKSEALATCRYRPRRHVYVHDVPGSGERRKQHFLSVVARIRQVASTAPVHNNAASVDFSNTNYQIQIVHERLLAGQRPLIVGPCQAYTQRRGCRHISCEPERHADELLRCEAVSIGNVHDEKSTEGSGLSAAGAIDQIRKVRAAIALQRVCDLEKVLLCSCRETACDLRSHLECSIARTAAGCKNFEPSARDYGCAAAGLWRQGAPQLNKQCVSVR